jgi:hypothetical protein
MLIEGQDELTPRQRKIIPLLLTKSVVEACKESRVGKKTIYHWLKQNAFRTALKAARDEVFNQAMGLIKTNCEDAVNVIVELMRQAEKEDSKIGAAAILLEHARWLKTTEDLQRRIELLEQTVSHMR